MKLTLTGRNGTAELPFSSIRLQTSLRTAGILEWETPCRSFLPETGDCVKLSDQEPVFIGYIFRVEDNGHFLRILCYDQMKYLLYRDTKQFFGKRADEILWEIIRERNLTPGMIENTGTPLPSLLWENQTLFSMLNQALSETFRISGKNFVLFDQAGAISLHQAGKGDCSLLLSGENQLTGWLRSADIDGSTFTRFKLLQEDGRSGFRRIMETENPVQRQKWGVLQYFERVSHSWNQAQLRERLRTLQRNFGGIRRSFSVSGIADFRCLAGREIFCETEGNPPVRCLITESRIEGKNNTTAMHLDLKEVSN